jgi:hypothetical protein
MALSKHQESSSGGKRKSPPGNKSSGAPKKAPSLFKTTSAPMSLKASTDVDIKFERVKGSHLTIWYLQKGQTDGYSKPLNDAIESGELAKYGFMYAGSSLRLAHDSDEPRKSSKGFNYRCFPHFTSGSDAPVTSADNLVAAGHLARILPAPASNKYNTQYRVLRDNYLTQNPPRSADFILTSNTIV